MTELEIRNNKDTKYIPMPLQGTTFYNVTDKKRYDQLYWRLRGIDRNVKPELGKLRPLPMKQRNSLFIATPIDVEMWDKAHWRGAAFYMDPTGQEIPYFLLPFMKEKPAKQIFSDWKSMYGDEDENDEIRIAIIEGEIPKMSTGYSINISPNIDRVIDRMIKTGIEPEEGMILSISRTQRANPTDNFKIYNLFKSQYNVHKKYILAPAVIDEKKGTIKPFFELGILKKNLIFKNVSEIERNDPENAVFLHANEHSK
jgi:hypothetical protein